jgi:hypothetical protein
MSMKPDSAVIVMFLLNTLAVVVVLAASVGLLR